MLDIQYTPIDPSIFSWATETFYVSHFPRLPAPLLEEHGLCSAVNLRAIPYGDADFVLESLFLAGEVAALKREGQVPEYILVHDDIPQSTE